MMKFNRTTYVIGASTLALIALFVFQVKWMSDSRNLIEQQFDQKVRMALCFAVESLNGTKINCDPGKDSCLPVEEIADAYQLSTPLDYELEVIDSTLSKAISFYGIDMEYNITILKSTCLRENILVAKPIFVSGVRNSCAILLNKLLLISSIFFCFKREKLANTNTKVMKTKIRIEEKNINFIFP